MRYIFIKSCCAKIYNHETGFCFCDFIKVMKAYIREENHRIKQREYYHIRKKQEEEKLIQEGKRIIVRL